MDDFMAMLTRELPGTDKDRYDAAYERGRARARSSLLFGGLTAGLAAGATLTFLLDPRSGQQRRAELGRWLGIIRTRVEGVMPGGRPEHGRRWSMVGAEAGERADLWTTPRSAAAPRATAQPDTDRVPETERVAVGAGSGR